MRAAAGSTSEWQAVASAPDEARLRSFAFAATGAALLVLFWPLTVGRLFVYADLGGFFLPLRLFFAERLARGESALWMPHLFCGFNLHGEGQLGIYHPLRRLAYTLLPVDRAFALESLLPLPLALAGFALLLRRLGLPVSAALFGGVCFGLSPYLTLRLTHLNTIAILAHVPWLLLAIDVLVRRGSERARSIAWTGAALLTGSQLLLGYPPAVALSLLMEGGYAAALLMRGARIAPLGALLAAKGVGLLLGAPQWLATWADIGSSIRAGADYAYRSQQSLHPLNLLLPVAPWLFRDRVYQVEVPNPIEQAFYLGAVAPVALIWVLARGRSLVGWSRKATFDALAACGAALALACGRYLPVHALAAQLPLIGMLRVPARYTVVVSLVSALFAALAFADLCRARARPDAADRRALGTLWIAPLLSLAVATGALWWRRGAGGAAPFNPPLELLAGPLLIALAALLFAAAARGVRLALPALFAFTLLDLGSYGATLWWSEPPLTLTQYLSTVPQTPSEAPQRLMTDYTMRIARDATGAIHHDEVTRRIARDARLVRGYVGLVPARRLDYATPAALRLAGASYTEIGGRVEPLPTPFPRARLVSRSVASADPAGALPRIDPADTAVVASALELGGGAPGSASVLEDAPGRLRVQVDAPTRQLLVTTEAWHPGWQARCDGAPCRVEAVYGDFLGAVVEPGVREVALRFAPDSLERGFRLAGAGAVALVVLPLAPVVARRVGRRANR
jgi:hypothetical protein